MQFAACLLLIFMVCACTTHSENRPKNQQSGLKQSGLPTCHEDEDLVRISVNPAAPAENLPEAATGYGLNGILSFSTEVSSDDNIQLDLCLASDDSVRLLAVWERTQGADRPYIDFESAIGLEELVFSGDASGVLILRKHFDFLDNSPYLVVFGKGSQLFYALQGTINQETMVIRSNHFMGGELVFAPMPSEVNCVNGEYVERVEQVFDAAITIKGCYSFVVAGGTSFIKPKSVTVKHDSLPESMLSQVGAERTFSAEDLDPASPNQKGDFDWGGGHHGCVFTFELNIPGVTYKKVYGTLEGKEFQLLRVAGEELQQKEIQRTPQSCTDAILPEHLQLSPPRPL